MRKILVTICMVILLAVFGGSSVLAFSDIGALPAEETEALPEYKIGVCYYSFADYLGSRIKRYFEYYGEQFNVEVFFGEGYSGETMGNVIDNFIQNEVDGIIMLSPAEGMVVAADEAGIPLMAFGNIHSRQDPKDYSKYEMFAGCITEDDEIAIREMLETVYEDGCRNIAYITPYAVDEANIRAYTIEKELEAGKYPGMKIVTSFVGSDIADAVQNVAISYPEIDAILATNGAGGTMETIFNVVYSMGLDWKMACLDIPQGAEQFFQTGQFAWSCGGQYASAGIAFAAIYDGINGNRWFKDTGDIMWRRFVNVTGLEEYGQYQKYIDGEVPVYTAQEVKEMIQVFNENASVEMIEEINNTYSVEDVVSRHEQLMN